MTAMLRLIFVEGVSGVGKTVMTRKLRDILRESGFRADCYLEFDPSNPIDFYCAAYFDRDGYDDIRAQYPGQIDKIEENTVFADDVRLVRYYKRDIPQFEESLLSYMGEREFCWRPRRPVPMAEYTRVYRIIWENFARNTEGYDYLLFDGSLIHHPANDLTRNYGASRHQIARHVNMLLESVTSLHPRVVYLSAGNIAQRLQRARVNRGEKPCLTDGLKFWEERRRTDMAILKKVAVPYRLYDISKENWDELLPEILDYITGES